MELQDQERYTCNGSVDIRGNPASKKRTGNWRACYSILGNIHGVPFYSTLIPVMSVVSAFLTFANPCPLQVANFAVL
jgi:hypothetical protein